MNIDAFIFDFRAIDDFSASARDFRTSISTLFALLTFLTVWAALNKSEFEPRGESSVSFLGFLIFNNRFFALFVA